METGAKNCIITFLFQILPNLLYRIQWFRKLPYLKQVGNYFPIDLVKTVDLPADRNYLFAVFPHGLIR